MKYQCVACSNVFAHPAKQTKHYPLGPQLDGEPCALDIERAVCPFCAHINIGEFVEPQEDITSVKSVPIEETDSWLAKGYKVRELYAKTATLVKLEAKQA